MNINNMEVDKMSPKINELGTVNSNWDATYEYLSREVLVDRMMSAGLRADEKMTKVFSAVYQRLLNEEDVKKAILDSIQVPATLAYQIIEYVAYDVD